MDAPSLTVFTCDVDADDARSIHEAIALYQRRSRWPEGGTLVAEGSSDLRGAVLGEICRAYLEAPDGR